MFEITREGHSISMVLSAEMQNVDRASEETRSFLVSEGMEARAFETILLAREALNNAVRHGCSSDPNMRIEYRCQIADGSLVLKIEDTGRGFNWRQCLCKEPDVSAECGRGLLLMRSYAVQVEFNEQGNHVVLRIAI